METRVIWVPGIIYMYIHVSVYTRIVIYIYTDLYIYICIWSSYIVANSKGNPLISGKSKLVNYSLARDIYIYIFIHWCIILYGMGKLL